MSAKQFLETSVEGDFNLLQKSIIDENLAAV